LHVSTSEFPLLAKEAMTHVSVPTVTLQVVISLLIATSPDPVMLIFPQPPDYVCPGMTSGTWVGRNENVHVGHGSATNWIRSMTSTFRLAPE